MTRRINKYLATLISIYIFAGPTLAADINVGDISKYLTETDRQALVSGTTNRVRFAALISPNGDAIISHLPTSNASPADSSPLDDLPLISSARPSILHSAFSNEYTRSTPIIENITIPFFCGDCVSSPAGPVCTMVSQCNGPIAFVPQRDSGGHSESTHDPRAPGRIQWRGQSSGVVEADGSTQAATLMLDTGPTGTDGITSPLTFSSPEIAGRVNAIWVATGPQVLIGIVAGAVKVQVAQYPQLGPFRYSADRRGHLQVVTEGQSHPDAGYGQQALGSALDVLLNSYSNCAAYRVPRPPAQPQPPDRPTDPLPPNSNLFTRDPPPLRSEAISLQYGGIYDFDLNYHAPHYGHRIGGEVDIGFSTINSTGTLGQQDMQCLYLAITAAGFTQPIPGERISMTNSVPPTYYEESYRNGDPGTHTHIWNSTREIQ